MANGNTRSKQAGMKLGQGKYNSSLDVSAMQSSSKSLQSGNNGNVQLQSLSASTRFSGMHRYAPLDIWIRKVSKQYLTHHGSQYLILKTQCQQGVSKSINKHNTRSRVHLYIPIKQCKQHCNKYIKHHKIYVQFINSVIQYISKHSHISIDSKSYLSYSKQKHYALYHVK